MVGEARRSEFPPMRVHYIVKHELQVMYMVTHIKNDTRH